MSGRRALGLSIERAFLEHPAAVGHPVGPASEFRSRTSRSKLRRSRRSIALARHPITTTAIVTTTEEMTADHLGPTYGPILQPRSLRQPLPALSRALDRTRTCGLPLRRRSLYPPELRGRPLDGSPMPLARRHLAR